MSKRIFTSQGNLDLGRNREQRRLDARLDKEEKPDLSFVEQGTQLICIGDGKFAEFCPLTYCCSKQTVDSNCFYGKFLNCDEAKILSKTHQLSQIDKFHLRYKR